MTTPLDPTLGIPTVYVVDDEDVVRDALARLLRSHRLPSEGFAGGEAFNAWLQQRMAPGHAGWPASPSCLLLDVRMPGMSGLGLFDRVCERGLLAELPVILLIGHADVPTAVAAVRRGAFDFVEKPISNNVLVDRVEQALAHSAAALRVRPTQRQHERQLGELTERERDVMGLVVDGRPNKLIAEALGISVRTVEVHRARVFERVGVESAVELSNLLRSVGARPGDVTAASGPAWS